MAAWASTGVVAIADSNAAARIVLIEVMIVSPSIAHASPIMSGDMSSARRVTWLEASCSSDAMIEM
jgi:hypothetical protein